MDAPTDTGSPADLPAPPPAPPGGRAGPRRLHRRPDDGPLAGVCAGVAEYFDIDPVIVRIATVVLFVSGPGFFAYVLAWIFVPAEDGVAGSDGPQRPVDRKRRRAQIFGVLLVACAVSIIWDDWWGPGQQVLFPLTLLGIGAWLLLRQDDEEGPDAASEGPVTHPTVASPAEGRSDPPGSSTTSVMPAPPWELASPADPTSTAPTARRRRMLGPAVFGALLVWTGLAWLADVALETGLAVGLLLLGMGFVLGAFVGGSRALIIPAFLVATALAVTTLVDIPLRGPVGQQRWTPTSADEVAGPYEVSIGEGTLDLTGIDVEVGDRLVVDASIGIGHLVVLVPEDLALDVTTDVGAGETVVAGETQSGVGVSTSRYVGDGAIGGTLVLDLQVGLGQVEVVRSDSVRPSRSGPTTPSTALG